MIYKKEKVPARKILFVCAGATFLFLSGCGLLPSDEPKAGRKPITQDVISDKYAGKKILFVNSYNKGYEWSDGVEAGVRTGLSKTGAELKTYEMDTKNKPSKEEKTVAGQEARKAIEEYRPDVVIVSDDNAFAYLVRPHYRDAELPIVSVAINWDASMYGAPYKNTVLMLEVVPITKLISMLAEYGRGSRVGFLAGNGETDRKNAEYYVKNGIDLSSRQYNVNTFAEWKEAFKKLQTDADLVIMENKAGITGWSDEEAKQYYLENVAVPTGATQLFMMPLALIGVVKLPQEQGEWAAKTSLEIIDGKPMSSFKVEENKKADFYLNLETAGKLNLTIKSRHLKDAKIYK